jgi:hypothetical protein
MKASKRDVISWELDGRTYHAEVVVVHDGATDDDRYYCVFVCYEKYGLMGEHIGFNSVTNIYKKVWEV